MFGRVSEGFDTLTRINGAYCDDDGRPYQNIRIHHVYILDDPFPDPAGLEVRTVRLWLSTDTHINTRDPGPLTDRLPLPRCPTVRQT